MRGPLGVLGARSIDETKLLGGLPYQGVHYNQATALIRRRGCIPSRSSDNGERHANADGPTSPLPAKMLLGSGLLRTLRQALILHYYRDAQSCMTRLSAIARLRSTCVAA